MSSCAVVEGQMKCTCPHCKKEATFSFYDIYFEEVEYYGSKSIEKTIYCPHCRKEIELF